MATIGNVTFACDDPGRLAAFWVEGIGERQPAPPGLLEAIEAEGGDPNAAAAAIDPESRGPRLFCKKMPKSEPEHIPIHLDLTAADREAEVERLVGLGATVVETKTETPGPDSETWTVMRDAAGNGFCVQAPA